jgi:hypothetical protein
MFVKKYIYVYVTICKNKKLTFFVHLIPFYLSFLHNHKYDGKFIAKR